MRAALRPSCILAALLLAGCTGPAPDPDPIVREPAPALSLSPAVQAFEACENRFGSCYEPTVAVDLTGTIYATAGLGGPVARSRDGGATWESLAGPPVLSALPGALHADATVQVDPAGRLYHHSLVAFYAQAAVMLEGIQVSRSDDQGETWASTFVGLPGPHVTLGADRQWLAFGPAGEVYLQYHRIDPILTAAPPPVALLAGDVRVARSDDGGATFGPFVQATRLGAHIGGQPSVGPDGTLAVPYFEVLATEGFAGTRLYVAESSDRGATFTSREIPVGAAHAGDFFPVAFHDGPELHVIFKDGDDRVRLATLPPGADGWSEPRRLSEAETAGSPWGAAQDGRLHVAWTEAGEDFRVVYQQRSLEGEVLHELRGEAFTAPGTRPNTDFTHFALAPGALPAIVWSDGGDDIRVAVAHLA